MNVSVNTFSLEMLAALWFFTSIILFDASNNPFKKLLFHSLTSTESRDPSSSYRKKEYVSGGIDALHCGLQLDKLNVTKWFAEGHKHVPR